VSNSKKSAGGTCTCNTHRGVQVQIRAGWVQVVKKNLYLHPCPMLDDRAVFGEACKFVDMLAFVIGAGWLLVESVDVGIPCGYKTF
jgi:hypothetical protein